MKPPILLIWFVLLFVSIAACSPDPSIAIATAVAGTTEAQIVQTGVAATQEAAFTPTPEPELLCVDIATGYLDETELLLDRWFDAVEIADSTARMSLSGPVGELQAIRRELTALEAPTCAASIERSLRNMMDNTIDGFLLFMQDEPDSEISAAFNRAGAAGDNYIAALERLTDEVVEATREAAATKTPKP
jgi:hypothetical protein